MKQLLIITFDFIRNSEPSKSLAVGYLMAYLKNDLRYGNEFIVDNISFNLYEQNLPTDQLIEVITKKHDLPRLEAIAIGCYVWSHYLINGLISELRVNGFTGKIILGGYQISYTDGIQEMYPKANVFVLGYGESSLLQALFMENSAKALILRTEPNFGDIPSPYLSGEIKILKGQRRVRLETKRGCPNHCSYCEHKDLQRHKVYDHNYEKVVDELAFLKAKCIKKINIIDPLFNFGETYLHVLRKCCEIDIEALITLQVNFANIKGKKGQEFLEICSSLNIALEFGFETVVTQELQALNRICDITHTRNVLTQLGEYGIPYKVNLMYGLPFQTRDSFVSSINFLLNNGCTEITAFPLMLLNGTQLWYEKTKWDIKESSLGPFHIPVVIGSNSFGKDEWEMMKAIAGSVRRKCKRNSNHQFLIANPALPH